MVVVAVVVGVEGVVIVVTAVVKEEVQIVAVVNLV